MIIGNREFFPDQLVAEAREDILKLFSECGVRPITMSPDDTKLGGIETHADARNVPTCSRTIATKSPAWLSCLPNFGDEKGVADTLKLSGLNVPVLIQAYPDDLGQLGVARRRDCILRQDFGLQQPGPSGHQVHAHRQARIGSEIR